MVGRGGVESGEIEVGEFGIGFEGFTRLFFFSNLEISLLLAGRKKEREKHDVRFQCRKATRSLPVSDGE